MARIESALPYFPILSHADAHVEEAMRYASRLKSIRRTPQTHWDDGVCQLWVRDESAVCLVAIEGMSVILFCALYLPRPG